MGYPPANKPLSRAGNPFNPSIKRRACSGRSLKLQGAADFNAVGDKNRHRWRRSLPTRPAPIRHSPLPNCPYAPVRGTVLIMGWHAIFYRPPGANSLIQNREKINEEADEKHAAAGHAAFVR